MVSVSSLLRDCDAMAVFYSMRPHLTLTSGFMDGMTDGRADGRGNKWKHELGRRVFWGVGKNEEKGRRGDGYQDEAMNDTANGKSSKQIKRLTAKRRPIRVYRVATN